MLNKFPIEILSIILDHSHSLLALWMCGDLILHSKMSKAAESLTLVHLPMGSFAPPTWLLQLHKLKRLSISSPTALLSHPNEWIPMLQQLPRSLESLTISSYDTNFAFSTQRPTADGTRSKLEFVPVAGLFPHLTSLTLVGAPTNVGIVSALPPTLTSFTANKLFPLPFMSKLPRSLTHMSLGTDKTFTPQATDEELDDLSQAPSGLAIEHLMVQLSDSRVAELLPKLPPSLLSLDLTAPLVPTDLLLLPRSLTVLDIEAINTSWLDHASELAAFWPPNLEKLATKCAQGNPQLIALLPRRIKRLALTLTGFRRPSVLHADELPPALEELRISALGELLINGVFPRTLRAIDNWPELSSERAYAAALPASIESIQLQLNIFNAENLSFPTPNIKTLSLSSWNTSLLPKGILPDTLTTLTIHSLRRPPSDSGKKVFRLLPQSLTSLAIVRGFPSDDSSFDLYANELPMLTHLKLGDDLTMPCYSIEHLPRSLTSLMVYLKGIESYPHLLALLPPNLVACAVSPEMGAIPDLAERLPPTAWRSLVGTPGASHIRRLRERLSLLPIASEHH